MPLKDSTQLHYYQQMSQQIKMVAIGCVVVIATLVVVGIIVHILAGAWCSELIEARSAWCPKV